MNFKLNLILFMLQSSINCNNPTAAAVPLAQCALNELYYNSTLSPICDVNCQALQRRCPLSSVRPVAGCYCKRNYARNLQQQCIAQKECANDCFPNEVPIGPEFKECEFSCRKSSYKSREKICYHLAEKRCICDLGYCRNGRGQCVKNTI